MSNNIVATLTALRAKIEQAKQDLAKAEGRKEELFKQLKEGFNCSTIEEAEKKLNALTAKRESLNQEIETKMQKLREDYDI